MAVTAPAAVKYRTRVVKDDDPGTYDAECACGFTSAGWPQRKLAAARVDEHAAEHETGEPMRELVDFRDEAGLNGPAVDVIDFTEGA